MDGAAAQGAVGLDVGRGGALRGGVQLRLTLPAAAFDRNLQDDLSAAPFFAVCLAYWYEACTGVPTGAHVRVDGPLTDAPHALRLRFTLHELAHAVGGRLALEPGCAWPMPSGLVMRVVLESGLASAG